MNCRPIKIFPLAILLLLSALPAKPFHLNSDADTARLQSLIDSLNRSDLTPGERISAAARSFQGAPYKAATLEITPEDVQINTSGFDCVTLIETAIAASLVSGRRAPLWTDFPATLENIRYRGGKANGYASRLHYFSDWITDNIYRGNITDITQSLDNSLFLTKQLDFISTHPDLYPALKDSATLAAIKHLELGFCNIKLPYIKKESLLKKKVTSALEDGDIIVFLTREPGLDVSHTGIISIINGVPHLTHASANEGRVITEKEPLHDTLKHSFRKAPGVRILRIKTD